MSWLDLRAGGVSDLVALPNVDAHPQAGTAPGSSRRPAPVAGRRVHVTAVHPPPGARGSAHAVDCMDPRAGCMAPGQLHLIFAGYRRAGCGLSGILLSLRVAVSERAPWAAAGPRAAGCHLTQTRRRSGPHQPHLRPWEARPRAKRGCIHNTAHTAAQGGPWVGIGWFQAVGGRLVQWAPRCGARRPGGCRAQGTDAGVTWPHRRPPCVLHAHPSTQRLWPRWAQR